MAQWHIIVDVYMYTDKHTHTHTTLSFRKYLSGKSDVTVRGNVAYGESASGEAAHAVYENIGKMVRFAKGTSELAECPTEFPVSQPSALVYATADEITKTGQQQHTSTETAM